MREMVVEMVGNGGRNRKEMRKGLEEEVEEGKRVSG